MQVGQRIKGSSSSLWGWWSEYYFVGIWSGLREWSYYRNPLANDSMTKGHASTPFLFIPLGKLSLIVIVETSLSNSSPEKLWFFSAVRVSYELAKPAVGPPVGQEPALNRFPLTQFICKASDNPFFWATYHYLLCEWELIRKTMYSQSLVRLHNNDNLFLFWQ